MSKLRTTLPKLWGWAGLTALLLFLYPIEMVIAAYQRIKKWLTTPAETCHQADTCTMHPDCPHYSRCQIAMGK